MANAGQHPAFHRNSASQPATSHTGSLPPTVPHATVQGLNAASRYSRLDYSPNLDEGRYYSAEKILAGGLHVRPSDPDLEARGR